MDFFQYLKPFIKKSSKKSFKRGQTIYMEGEDPEHLYFVESGLVGLYHVSESGKETFLRIFEKDNIFGHRSYFAATPYHANAIALNDCEVRIISNEQCSEICETQPLLLKELTKIISIELGEAEQRLAGLLDKTANARISETLVFLKLKYPKKVWTRKEIADFSGSTLETVTRVMTKLSNNQLLEKEGRDFKILNIEELLNFF